MNLEPQHDAHVALAHKTFRDCGFSLEAMQYPRCPAGLDALRRLNGAPESWRHPFAWSYYPNAAMASWWARRLAEPN